MIKVTCIDELKIGQNICGFYQSIFKEKKISKNGDYYIDLLLKDSTGQINAKIWKFCDFYDKAFIEGDLVAVKGIVKKYRKNLFLEIQNISLLEPNRYQKYGFQETDILCSIEVSVNMIFNKVLKDISGLSSPYKELLFSIYDSYQDKIKTFPDEISSIYYGKRGSLILKIYNALRITKSIYKNKFLNDQDIIISGILLKYIGRIKQYNQDVTFSLSKIGKNENCFILGRDIIKNFSNKTNKISKSIVMELIDIVLYDHKSTDFQKQENNKGAIVCMIFELERAFSANQSKVY
tara:strand:+ start:1534 stop:2412 length:879 start_codon:yes stop_codon:yes gene_type:complete